MKPPRHVHPAHESITKLLQPPHAVYNRYDITSLVAYLVNTPGRTKLRYRIEKKNEIARSRGVETPERIKEKAGQKLDT